MADTHFKHLKKSYRNNGYEATFIDKSHSFHNFFLVPTPSSVGHAYKNMKTNQPIIGKNQILNHIAQVCELTFINQI